MDFNKLTIKTQEAVAAAQELARRAGNPELYPEHLLLALLDQELPRSSSSRTRPRCAPRPRRGSQRSRRSRARRSSRPRASPSRGCSTRRPSEAKRLEDEYVSIEHLLLALDAVPRDALLAQIKEVRGGQRVTSAGPRGHLPGAREVRPRPDRGGRAGQARPGDRARRGDPARDPGALAADEEQPGADRRARRRQDRDRRGARAADRRRRRARGPEGQARLGARRRRAAGRREVPRRVRGAAEGRARRDHERRGRRSSSSSTSCTRSSAPARPRARSTRRNMLKPMLARGELRAVGATTLDEYRKHIEKDAALERRFQPVFVGEPSVADTIAILRGLKEKYESHHRVRIRDAALVAAAVLSDRYIADRQLPDKAIDLVDESASRLKMEIDSSPLELDQADRAVRQLEIELAAMAKESDDVREPVERELADAKERRDELAARWAEEKAALDRIGEISRADRRAEDGGRAGRARRRPPARRRDPLRRAARARAGARRARRARRADGEGGGRRGRHRRRRRRLDGDPRLAAARGRDREADPHGGAAAPARDRPARCGGGGLERAPPRALGAPGSRPADRLVRLPRPDRRRQDRARAGARRVHVRRRAGDDPDRHVRVPGAAHRVAPRRRAARLRRLRRGRPADRGRPPPAVLGRPARRDREGAHGGLRRAAAGARRRPADRRPGPHGRLPQHRPDHDLEHPLAPSRCASTSGPSS